MTDEAPEADAIEHEQSEVGSGQPTAPRRLDLGPEVPEADALEQSIEVELEDDYRD